VAASWAMCSQGRRVVGTCRPGPWTLGLK
jgi:hypothetical protein